MRSRGLLLWIVFTCDLSVGCGHQDEANTAPSLYGGVDASPMVEGQGLDGAMPTTPTPDDTSGRGFDPPRPVQDAAAPPDPVADAESDAGTDEPADAAVPPPQAQPDGPGRSGSAIALSPDDGLAVVANRDVGSISVLELAYEGELLVGMALDKELPVGPGSEPYQVVFTPDGEAVLVSLRRDQELLRIEGLRAEPRIAARVAVGSEPTGLALNGAGTRAYVANWNDGTVSVVDTSAMEVVRTVDLNGVLVAGHLGDMQPRPALAHPRSIAVAEDALYVTEFFGQQVQPELPDATNADTRKVGLLYRIALPDWAVTAVPLRALEDMGFRDDRNGVAGCYPNQLQSVTLNGGYAYVLSVCASPEGPLGVRLTTTECDEASDCADLVAPACVRPVSGATAVCADFASVKTTSAPVVSIVDVATQREIDGSPVSLNAAFAALFEEAQVSPQARRLPLFASEIAFVDGASVGYVSANGSDSVFRFETDPDTGAIKAVGATTNTHIDLAPEGIAEGRAGNNPIGFAIGRQHKKVALVANDVSRNVSALDFNTQALAGGAADPEVVATSPLPTEGGEAASVLRGKRFFNTGLGRWSLDGQGWGACQVCHADGLTDNVTWYFARGPRQSTSLDGSFASTRPGDQRVFNWTATADEIADFEANTRGVSGGVGAIVSAVSSPPQTGDRIDVAGLGHGGLDGSSRAVADPGNPLDVDEPSQLDQWADIEAYVQSIRSPRAPTNLDPALVEAGRAVFEQEGRCQGCHGGEKWTVSRRFYAPSVEANAALAATSLSLAAGFPEALLPAREQGNQVLRLGEAGLDQIACVLRSVGTFGVAEPGVGIAELRADMTTPAQGNGDAAGEGRGYNVPSLLGVAAGAPYLHAGSVRTLEALFADEFARHHRALAANFLTESDPEQRAGRVAQLVQFLLSIDESSSFVGLPATGSAGGALCPAAF